MDVIERDGQKYLTVAAALCQPFYLPVNPAEVDVTLNEVGRLAEEQLAAIIKAAGHAALAGLHPDRLRHAAMSCAQDAWYQATRGNVPEKIRAAHAERMQKYDEQVREHESTVVVEEAKLPSLPADLSPSYENFKDYVVQLNLAGQPAVYLFLKRPGGLAMTLERLREARSPELYRGLLLAAGYDVPAEAAPEAVYPAAAGVVQRWWHEAVAEHGALLLDGEVDETPTPLPEGYVRDQRARYARLLAARPKPKPPKLRFAPLPNGEKRPIGRPVGAVKRYIKTEKLPAELAARKGQNGFVAKALLAAAGPETAPELTARAVAAGLTSDKQAPERVTLYYLNQFQEKGYVEVKG